MNAYQEAKPWKSHSHSYLSLGCLYSPDITPAEDVDYPESAIGGRIGTGRMERPPADTDSPAGGLHRPGIGRTLIKKIFSGKGASQRSNKK